VEDAARIFGCGKRPGVTSGEERGGGRGQDFLGHKFQMRSSKFGRSASSCCARHGRPLLARQPQVTDGLADGLIMGCNCHTLARNN